MLGADRATVKALELRAPRASAQDFDGLQSQLRSGKIFCTLGDVAREDILARLKSIDGMIPSLFTFFKDLQYLQVCVDSVKRLTSLTNQETVMAAMERIFTGLNQAPNQVVTQITESTFTIRAGSQKEQVGLGYRQLFLFAMRHILDMPKESRGHNILAKATSNIDETVLCSFGKLANKLGFESPEITALRQLSSSRLPPQESTSFQPALTTDGLGEPIASRCGLPRKQTYERDCKNLFFHNLHTKESAYSSDITSFYVLRARYLAFFGTSCEERTSRPMTSPPFVSYQEHVNYPSGHLQGSIMDDSDDVIVSDIEMSEENVLQKDTGLEQETLEQRNVKIWGNERPSKQALETKVPKVLIQLKVKEDGAWKFWKSLSIDPSNPRELEYMARQKLKEKIRILNTRQRILAPEDCFEAVTSDGTRTILLLPEEELVVTE